MKRLEIVDFLKGYSIFTIMIFHYLLFLNLNDPYNKLIFFGGTGIHLFILLSGFGLYYSFKNKPLSYPAFLKRRFSKVYFPYIFVVLISAFISLFIPIYENSLYALGGHIFLYKMFDESIIGSYGYQLWFISMIFQFYLTFHLIIWIKSKLKPGLFFISALLISLCWALFIFLINKGDQRVWNSFFLQYLWEFALGILIADMVHNNKKISSKLTNQFSLIAIGLISCGIYAMLALKGGNWGKLFNDIFALTGYSLLAVFLYKLNIKLINRVFLFIGDISLSVFLLHYLVLFTVSKVFTQLDPVYAVIFSLTLILPISYIYQKGVDAFFEIIK